MNLNEVFWKDLINDNIKSHQKNRALLSLSLEDIFLEKPQKGGQFNPSPILLRVNMVS